MGCQRPGWHRGPSVCPDVVDHNPLPGQGPGLDGIKQLVGVYHAVFPDLSVSTDDVIASGDRVAVRWTAIGTHQGDQLGVLATGKQVRLTGIDILRIEDGRIVERWGETNGLEMMQQITSFEGAAPLRCSRSS